MAGARLRVGDDPRGACSGEEACRGIEACGHAEASRRAEASRGDETCRGEEACGGDESCGGKETCGGNETCGGEGDRPRGILPTRNTPSPEGAFTDPREPPRLRGSLTSQGQRRRILPGLQSWRRHTTR